MAILVMLNNYFHDLATAVFAVSAVTAYLLRRSLAMQAAPGPLRPVVAGLVRLGLFSLAWTLFFGIIRGLTYRQYEWMEAAGRDQVAALVVKHVILVFLVVLGLMALRKVRRIGYAPASEQVGR
jgi:hypothetical protein